MSAIVRAGRNPGVLEVIYDGEVTMAMRRDAVARGESLMGSLEVPVAIIDFQAAELAWGPEEAREFQTHYASSLGVDYSLIIYVAGEKHRAVLEVEAAIGNELGRMIEVVGDLKEAYALIEESEEDGD